MGYYQISLASNSKGVTSFCTSFGFYEFHKLPMGISVVSLAIGRVVDEHFADLKDVISLTSWKICLFILPQAGIT